MTSTYADVDGYRDPSEAVAWQERVNRRPDVRAFPLLMTDPADAFGLPSWPRVWRARGIGDWTEPALQQWDQAFAGPAAEGGFVFALLYLVVAGTRPS